MYTVEAVISCYTIRVCVCVCVCASKAKMLPHGNSFFWFLLCSVFLEQALFEVIFNCVAQMGDN